MSNTDTSSDTDPALDAAILAADKQRESYVLERLNTRRKMAIVAFGQLVFGGAIIIIAGLWVPALAERIDHMGTFLSIYFAALSAIIMAYWGIGSYERNSFGGMGGMGSMMGGGSYGGYTGAVAPQHAPLVKNPKPAGT